MCCAMADFFKPPRMSDISFDSSKVKYFGKENYQP